MHGGTNVTDRRMGVILSTARWKQDACWKKVGGSKKIANWGKFFLVANCWFKPSPEMLGICRHEMRFENRK